MHEDNPLCGWLRGKELSEINENEQKSYKLISCSDESHVVGRYVSFISNDLDTPLTLCQGKTIACIYIYTRVKSDVYYDMKECSLLYFLYSSSLEHR